MRKTINEKQRIKTRKDNGHATMENLQTIALFVNNR